MCVVCSSMAHTTVVISVGTLVMVTVGCGGARSIGPMALAGLTDGDVERVRSLGVRTIIDLRGADEVADKPSRLPEDVDVVALPMLADATDRPTVADVLSGAVDAIRVTDMAALYQKMLAEDAIASGVCSSSSPITLAARCCSTVLLERTAQVWLRRSCSGSSAWPKPRSWRTTS